ALEVSIDLRPGEERVVCFFLGAAPSEEEAQSLLQRCQQREFAAKAFEEVKSRWQALLTTIQIETPNRALDLLVNRWLLYQTLSCRIWARSAFYQSGGAYGFRDQLQDVLALAYTAPQEARKHLIRAASRQFLEGDVQHWWHPSTGAGVRTRFSDDLLWLPYAV